jgi:23S rRNA (adenine2503-C2)-methyltransferase
MKVIKYIEVPTGSICIGEGDKGLLEFLSIGDYGKEKNLKADFLGLTDEINGVPHGKLLPLEEKWVVTISSQYGCSMGCVFCDVPKVGPGINATVKDLTEQVTTAINLHPNVMYTDRLNLHYARMGEPTFNFNVIPATRSLKVWMDARNFKFHPVVSTMMPNNNNKLGNFISEWIQLKNELMEGEAGLQLSINTTNNDQREKQFGGSCMGLGAISIMMKKILEHRGLVGRKIALNFAITGDTRIDGGRLAALFDPKYFMCKLTPMHETESCISRGMLTEDGYSNFYPYQKHEQELKQAGFDVIVFIPSREEDESRITCGNAILSDKG